MTADTVMVIDLETTGLKGYESDEYILSIGIVSVDLKYSTVTPLFYTPIRQWLTDSEERSWIFTHGHMSLEEVHRSPLNGDQTAEIVSRILDRQTVTSYNTEFDLDKFLLPWLEERMGTRSPRIIRAPCIMKASAQLNIPQGEHGPTLATAYEALCTPDRSLRNHNAMDDAIMAGRALLALHARGRYDPCRGREY